MAAPIIRVFTYLVLALFKQKGNPEEITGTITFDINWDGDGEIVTHEILADTGQGAEDVSNLLFRDATWNMSHVETKVRVRREAPTGEDYVRHGAECLRRQKNMLADETPQDGKVKLGKSVHVALMVTEKEAVQMTCHYCDNGESDSKKKKKKKKKKDKEDKEESMLWYKIERESTKKHTEIFKVEEVQLDMHDSDKKNRVFVTNTHTLIVRKVTHKDGGTYFCRDMTKSDQFFKKTMTPEEIATFFEADDKLRFMYHLDVISAKGDDWKTKMVTTNKDLKSKLPLATPDVKVADYNMEIFTSWEEWSSCSTCDQAGTKRRLGICMVRKINKAEKSMPWYVNTMLNIYTRGVLCRSTVFNKKNKLHLKVFRSFDEMEEVVCNVSCTNYTMNIKDLVITESGQIKIEVFVLKEGESVAMACPNAPVDMPVCWVNGTRVLIKPYIRSLSDDRLRIDDNNTFYISRLEVTDSGHYLCIVGGKIVGSVMLAVEPIPPEAIVWLYAYYLICTYPFDFAIFVLFLCTRHVQRGKVLDYDKLPQLDDDSDTASGSSASDINVNRNANANARRFIFPSSVTMLRETAQPFSHDRLISAKSSSVLG